MYLSPLWAGGQAKLSQYTSSGDKLAGTCFARLPYTGSPNEYHPVVFSGRKVTVLEMSPVVPEPNLSFPYEIGSDIFEPQNVSFRIATFNTDYIDRVELSYYFNSSGNSGDYGDTHATQVSMTENLGDYRFEHYAPDVAESTAEEYPRWYGNLDDRKSYTFTDKGFLTLGKYGARGGVTYNGRTYISNTGNGYWYSYCIEATVYLKTKGSFTCSWWSSHRFYTENGHSSQGYRASYKGLDMVEPAVLYKNISLS